MARSDVHPGHEFADWQVWPGAYGTPSLAEAYPQGPRPGLVLDQHTPIASMGSCFAREIKQVLQARGYNYVAEETHHPAARHASAAWERLYNTFSMRQVLEYTFGDWQPGLRWWRVPDSGTVQDPYRRVVLYGSLEQAEADFALHRQHSRRALTRARVLILTLGLTEIWQDRADGAVICLPAGPYVTQGGDMGRYQFRVSRYQENLDNLEGIQQIMALHNPACHLVVTVSPVHLWATFRGDADVISASCNSKSTLRAAADEFASRHANVSYFPAYEIATILCPLLGRPAYTSGRENFHVNQATVELIMDNFFAMYGQGS
ncbi:MAG: GSCFA domain-containing protein [Desulfarculus sp.]|nr:GSCFA domain-containing protein [Desulfarculus sp.]